jgi:predicted O-methyltransferase YrrM
VIDDAVERVQRRLEELDARERREGGVPFSERSRAISPTTGRFLFALVSSHPGCEVLEIGGSRGYSTTWLAAGARILGGHVTSLEINPRKCQDWRQAIGEAGLSEWADLVEGDAHETLAAMDDVFDVVFLDADKDDYERLFALARARVEPGALIVADNVLSHADTLGAYSAARQADRTLSSVTVPLDSGLELTVVLGPQGG